MKDPVGTGSAREVPFARWTVRALFAVEPTQMDAPCGSGCRGLPEADEPVVGNYFVSTYPPFSTWSKNGQHHLDRVLNTLPVSSDPLGLYVHIPFCAERCQYCYYLSYDDKTPSDMDAYVDAVVQELALYRDRPAVAGRSASFVYFGGGTPSLLSRKTIERFLARLQTIMSWDRAKEVTFECAPKSVTNEKMQTLRDAGVTRVSIGVQQLDDAVLAANGRIHRVADVARAYGCIRGAGFRVVNVDLIVGLVGETDDTVVRTLEQVLAMQPDSVTIYQLEIPHNTPLYQALHSETMPSPPPDWCVKHRRLLTCFARLEQAGYILRSAYTAVRDPIAHQFIYQDAQYHGADLLGIGLASFSYLNGVHFQNIASFNGFLELVRGGVLPVARTHCLDDEERLIREFVLQLKLGSVSTAYFQHKFNVDIHAHFARPLASCLDCGWITQDLDGVAMTREGLARVDRLIPAFYPPRHRGLRYS